MAPGQTRKNKPRNYGILAGLRQNLSRTIKAKAHRKPQTPAEAAKARRAMKKILEAASKALAMVKKAERNATMRNGTRSRRAPNANTGMATRRSVRVAAKAANQAITAQKKAVTAAVASAAKAAKMNKKIEEHLRRLNAEDAAKKAKEAQKVIIRAQLEAEEAENSAERAAAVAEKKLNVAASSRKNKEPSEGLTNAQRASMNALATQMGKMRLANK